MSSSRTDARYKETFSVIFIDVLCCYRLIFSSCSYCYLCPFCSRELGNLFADHCYVPNQNYKFSELFIIIKRSILSMVCLSSLLNVYF